MPKILHRDRAIGVHPDLLAFLDWWEANGPFDLTIPQDGGLRTDQRKQALFFATNVSGAASLDKTPHGRGGALDLIPIFGSFIDWKNPEPFQQMGVIAEQRGLVWGGRWHKPDRDHVELKSWKELPMPGTP